MQFGVRGKQTHIGQFGQVVDPKVKHPLSDIPL